MDPIVQFNHDMRRNLQLRAVGLAKIQAIIITSHEDSIKHFNLTNQSGVPSDE